MKKIVNQKVYDTSTSTKIADFDNGFSDSDFDYIRESLYVTKKGNFFLAGEGGAKTRYTKSYRGCMTNSRGIIPLSIEEVIKWAEETDTTHIIEKHIPSHILEMA